MGNPAGRRVSRDTARDGRSRRAYGARPVVRACRAKARHRGVGAKAFWLLCRFCKVTRRKAGTLSGRCRSNGYVQKIKALSPRLSRRRGNRLGDAEEIRWPVCCATARQRGVEDGAAPPTGRVVFSPTTRARPGSSSSRPRRTSSAGPGRWWLRGCAGRPGCWRQCSPHRPVCG